MATRPSADDLKRYWGLAEMQTERVWFRQTYIDPKVGPEGRPLCSAIIALVTNDAAMFSDMHRLPTDELWLFHLGDPIELLLLHPDGRDDLVVLGPDVLGGQVIQHVVPAGTWMGARLRPGGEYGVWGKHDGTRLRHQRLRGRECGGADRALAASGRAHRRPDPLDPGRARQHAGMPSRTKLRGA